MSTRLMFAGAAAAMCLTVSASAQVPAGWRCSGTCVRDTIVRHEGVASAAVQAGDEGVGTFRQAIHPEAFLGRRVRFSAWVRTDTLNGFAFLWMRVDGQEPGETLQFDNMFERPIASLTDWKQYSVVLDVPRDAAGMIFGLIVQGKGRAWMDHASLEVVPDSVASTHIVRAAAHAHAPASAEQRDAYRRQKAAAPRSPTNLDIEQRR